MNMLKNIVNNKLKEISEKKVKFPVKFLENSIDAGRVKNSLKNSLSDPSRKKIIAEFKRRSPSKGMINTKSEPASTCKGYYESGAAGVSVLTDYPFFGGTIDDLIKVRSTTDSPLLRKDFIVDEYQITESAAVGADVILLIAAILDKYRLKELAVFAKNIGLQVLFEIHCEAELVLINEFVDIVGVNNRNLSSFITDIRTSFELADKIPGEFLKISESGIDSPETLRSLQNAGYQGFLIGERFMIKENPVNAFKDFVKLI